MIFHLNDYFGILGEDLKILNKSSKRLLQYNINYIYPKRVKLMLIYEVSLLAVQFQTKLLVHP